MLWLLLPSSLGKEVLLDQYVGRHQQAHNELLFLEEPVAETKKVTDFLAGIRDPKLETAIQTCMGDEQKLTNFEVCQQYFKTIVENTKTRTKSPSDIREIAKVGIVKDKKKAKQKKGKSSDDDKSPSGIAIHSGQYSAKDYNKLKPFEKAKVKQLRRRRRRRSLKLEVLQLSLLRRMLHLTMKGRRPLSPPTLENSLAVLPMLSSRSLLDDPNRLLLRQT
ncbi:hypothetical protein MHU86_1536 [Fragilaria crotonensis]|nr:hypothetical protein MHU86_1536 [Fragilaria crotonensis]